MLWSMLVDETLIGASFRSGTKNARLPQGDIPCGRSFFSLVRSQLLSSVRKKLMHSSIVKPSIWILSYWYAVVSPITPSPGLAFTTTGLFSVLIAISLVFIPRLIKIAFSIPGISTDCAECSSPSMTANWKLLPSETLNSDRIVCQYWLSSWYSSLFLSLNWIE